MRKAALALAGVMLVGSLTGCSGREELDALNGLEALNSESSVTSNYSLSYTDEQNMVYAQVSSRKLLDLSRLEKCTDNEIQAVTNFMTNVDNQLIGRYRVNSYENQVEKFILEDMAPDESVIDTYLTDYLLSFFERSPYYWQRTQTTVRGIDPSSRSIIVDVKYKTIGFEKEVVPPSTITHGEPNYDLLMQNRYTKWTNILELQLSNPNDPDLQMLRNDFERYYGDPEEIIKAQRSLSPTGAIYETGNQRTYTGMIDSENEKGSATCTVRYILVPNYVLGINLGMTCDHMYIIDYKLDNDITADLSVFNKEGYATVADSVYDLAHRYFTCVDESNFDGLYKLVNNFDGLDKFYEDQFDSTYQKHDGFSISLFDIVGTHITCGITVSTKERAKNSNMTFPIYTDRYYAELELVDDTLKIDNLVHISRVLEGEPSIDTEAADVSGFSASIDLDNDAKLAIEKLICDFSSIQLLGDTDSDEFSRIVDISISQNQLSSLKNNMMLIKGARKVVFLQLYKQGTSNYASVRCKELFQDETNAIIEAAVTYEFILKGGRWYVYNYDVNSSVRLDTTNLNMTGSLCLVSPGKVESYSSQITSTMATNIEEVSDTSVSFNHDEYEPQLKSGVQEQGYRTLTPAEVTEEVFDRIAMTASSELLYQDFNSKVDMLLEAAVGNEEALTILHEVKQMGYEAVAVSYNILNSLYLADEITDIKTDLDTRLNNLCDAIMLLRNNGLEDYEYDLTSIVSVLRALNRVANN